MDGQTNGQTDGWTNASTGGLTYGRTNKPTDGRTEGQMDGEESRGPTKKIDHRKKWFSLTKGGELKRIALFSPGILLVFHNYKSFRLTTGALLFFLFILSFPFFFVSFQFSLFLFGLATKVSSYEIKNRRWNFFCLLST